MYMLSARAWAKGVGFSSDGHRMRDNTDSPRIWDARQAAAVQQVEDCQRSDLLWALADSLEQPQGARLCHPCVGSIGCILT